MHHLNLRDTVTEDHHLMRAPSDVMHDKSFTNVFQAVAQLVIDMGVRVKVHSVQGPNVARKTKSFISSTFAAQPDLPLVLHILMLVAQSNL